jgi:hypothetical protein
MLYTDYLGEARERGWINADAPPGALAHWEKFCSDFNAPFVVVAFSDDSEFASVQCDPPKGRKLPAGSYVRLGGRTLSASGGIKHCLASEAPDIADALVATWREAPYEEAR